MEIEDADTTPISDIGVKGALLEKMLSSQVYTAGQLGAWLRARSYQRISGVGREQMAKLSDLLISHQLKRQKAKVVGEKT